MELICIVCKKDVNKVRFDSKKGGFVCDECRRAESQRMPILGIHSFPRDGIFLEHVSHTGRRFFSKQEMRDFERNTGTLIGMLHDGYSE